MSAELWRRIPCAPDYEVSNLGQVRSFRRCPSGRLLSLNANNRGYVVVMLSTDDGLVPKSVHRLVADAFVAPAEAGLQVRHLDGDRRHNEATNLAWGTQAENEADKVLHGTQHQLNKTHCPRRHEYTPENTRISKTSRICKACAREKKAEARAAARLAALAQVHHLPVAAEPLRVQKAAS